MFPLIYLGCKDKRSDCQSLAYRGDCKANPLFMFDECMETCGVCSDIGEKTGEYVEQRTIDISRTFFSTILNI